MSRTHSQSTFLLRILLFVVTIWVVGGIWASIPIIHSIWILHDYQRFPQEVRELQLYGSDYAAYQLLRQTPPTSRILMVVPDTYFRNEANYFLYPRILDFVFDLSLVTTAPLETYDYVLIHATLTHFEGLMKGIYRAQSQYQWTEEKLYALDQYFNSASPSATLAEFHTKLTATGGNLIYKLSTQ